VCHQTVSLVARELEASGIPTVIAGAAKDIVETVGVPRFVFSDVPLGNSMGLPGDPATQEMVLETALRLLESAFAPRSTVQSSVRWPGDPHRWKLDLMNLAGLDARQIEAAKASFENEKARAQSVRG
jgi:hypothetical protein